MTAFFDSAKAIISRFDMQWAAAHPAFPIVHDNQHYEPAEGVDFVYLARNKRSCHQRQSSRNSFTLKGF
jgi:hypothetical protein